jgi:hypothetical protein
MSGSQAEDFKKCVALLLKILKNEWDRSGRFRKMFHSAAEDF